MAPRDEVRLPISSDLDVVVARQQGRSLAAELGFGSGDQTLIATAISELTRNIVAYAGRGELVLRPEQDGARVGLTVIASDRGPGIPDVDRALEDGFSTGNSLGLGLPGTRRLMDEFDIQSAVGDGTTVTVTKWVR